MRFTVTFSGEAILKKTVRFDQLLPHGKDRAPAVHFVGICGAGCRPLAMLLAEASCRVSGSDLQAPGVDAAAGFAAAGIEVRVGHREENLPDDADVLVYSPAADASNPELLAAHRRGVPLLRRGEMLAEVARSFRRVVAVSGSHGKSSISAMLAYLLEKSGLDVSYLIGAELSGGLRPWRCGDGDVLVVESDESDGTNSRLEKLFLGIVPNLEDDHVWSLPGGVEALKANFIRFAGVSEKLLYRGGTLTGELYRNRSDASDLNARADLAGIARRSGKIGFEAENFATVLAAGEVFGIEAEKAAEILSGFPGVERRMSLRASGLGGGVLLMEDYAHHPTELEHSLAYLKKRFPERYFRVVFQPHRYARLARYYDDFVRILRQYPDEVILTDVFAAWSEKGECDSASLAAAVGEKARYAPEPFPQLAKTLCEASKTRFRASGRPELIAVVGAGDVAKFTGHLAEMLKNTNSGAQSGREEETA